MNEKQEEQWNLVTKKLNHSEQITYLQERIMLFNINPFNRFLVVYAGMIIFSLFIGEKNLLSAKILFYGTVTAFFWHLWTWKRDIDRFNTRWDNKTRK